MNETNAREAAKHIRGATIAWGADQYLDLEQPDSIRVTLEDYAYCLAYTVRWRGQARMKLAPSHPPSRPFYGVGQHVVFGAEELLAEGHDRTHAIAFLFHESDELPFGDFPGPAKSIPCVRAVCDLAKRIGNSIDEGFGVDAPDPDLIKRWDIRMLITEKRDLLSAGFMADTWHNAGSGGVSEVGYEPFKRKIVPYAHPEQAALRFLDLARQLGVTDAR